MPRIQIENGEKGSVFLVVCGKENLRKSKKLGNWLTTQAKKGDQRREKKGTNLNRAPTFTAAHWGVEE